MKPLRKHSRYLVDNFVSNMRFSKSFFFDSQNQGGSLLHKSVDHVSRRGKTRPTFFQNGVNSVAKSLVGTCGENFTGFSSIIVHVSEVVTTATQLARG